MSGAGYGSRQQGSRCTPHSALQLAAAIDSGLQLQLDHWRRIEPCLASARERIDNDARRRRQLDGPSIQGWSSSRAMSRFPCFPKSCVKVYLQVIIQKTAPPVGRSLEDYVLGLALRLRPRLLQHLIAEYRRCDTDIQAVNSDLVDIATMGDPDFVARQVD